MITKYFIGQHLKRMHRFVTNKYKRIFTILPHDADSCSQRWCDGGVATN